MGIKFRGVFGAVLSLVLIPVFAILALMSIGRPLGLEFAGRLFGAELTVDPARLAALSQVERIAFVTFGWGLLLLSLVLLWSGLSMIRTAQMPSARQRFWIKAVGIVALAGIAVFLAWNGERVRIPRF